MNYNFILNGVIPLLSLILSINLVLFYLDDFKLSSNKYIKILQILSPLFILLFFLGIYSIMPSVDILYASQPGKGGPSVTVGAQVEIGQEAAKEISRGISSLGSNIGLAGTVGAVATATAKVIAKSPLPPLQKAAVVLGGAVIGGAVHSGFSTINKIQNSNPGETPTSGSSTGSDIVKKFVADNTGDPLKDLVFSIDLINYACLGLIIVLAMILLFKFYLNEESFKLNLSNFIGDKLNNNLNHYLIKIIQLNKKTSTIYVFIIFILLIIGLIFNCYFTTFLYENLDKFVEFHLSIKK
jgi:hypothetical protein